MPSRTLEGGHCGVAARIKNIRVRGGSIMGGVGRRYADLRMRDEDAVIHAAGRRAISDRPCAAMVVYGKVDDRGRLRRTARGFSNPLTLFPVAAKDSN